MTADLNPLLVRPWLRPGGRILLGLDLWGGDRIREIHDIDEPGGDLKGALLIHGAGVECRPLAGGGLVVGEGVLWSFVDPLRAGLPAGIPGAERTEVETDLRQARRRFLAGIRWLRDEAAGEIQALRALLAGLQPDLGPLLDLLEECPVGEVKLPPDPRPQQGPEDRVAGPTDDPQEIFSWMGAAGGLGALYGEGFAPRTEQAEMSRQVAAALAAGRPLLVEAGTGVGKTLAYLVALLARAGRLGARAVVSTHTRALQRQIIQQDLPRLRRAWPDLTDALLMGRRNYLCLRQRQAYLSRPVEDLHDALQVGAFRLWLKATGEGMREELEDHPLLGTELRALFDAADLCLPGLCYESDRCFVQRARRQARGADLLIVNHSLLLSDLRAGGTLLGDYELLVVDEAHRLPGATLDAYAIACGAWRAEEIEELTGPGAPAALPARVRLCMARLEECGPAGREAAGACEAYGRLLGRAVADFQVWWHRVGEILAPGLPQDESGSYRSRVRDKAEAFGPLRAETTRCLEGLAEAAAAAGRFGLLAGEVADPPAHLQDDLAQLAQAGQLAGRLHQDIHFLVEDPDEEWVTWVEPARNRRIRRLGATLLESGNLLREAWLERGLDPVMTSATLAVGNDFTHMIGELGLSRLRPPTLTSLVPSPFDYHRQAMVLTPAHFLAPDAPGFGRAVGEILAELVLRTGRKTMGLFTSYRQLREAGQAILDAGICAPGEAARLDEPVLLRQDSGDQAGVLLDGFRRHRRAVLLGTSSFWEGVDFPGEDLEILVVAKLPFLVPNDPWVEARCERVAALGENPFTEFMVRDAVLRLKQGFGRLIRRPTDKGVVVILDHRLHTKNYGTTFLNGLPLLPRMFGDGQELLGRIAEFFGGEAP